MYLLIQHPSRDLSTHHTKQPNKNSNGHVKQRYTFSLIKLPAGDRVNGVVKGRGVFKRRINLLARVIAPYMQVIFCVAIQPAQGEREQKSNTTSLNVA